MSATATTLERAAPPLSRRLWGLDWQRLLPWRLGDDVSAEAGAFDDAAPFMDAHYGDIFGAASESRFLEEPMTDAKRRFCAEMDVFLFRASGQTVGVFIAHPTDWSTYYVRSTAFVPEYRARGLMSAFVARLWPALRDAGVARVETDASPANLPVLGLHVKEGFVVTASGTSERWGSFLHLTKFLTPEPREVFSRQFVRMPARTTGFLATQGRSRP